MNGPVEIAALGDEERVALETLLDDEMGGRVQVRLGEAVDVVALPGLVVHDRGRVVAACCYTPGPGSWEVAFVEVIPEARGRGLAGALLEHVAALARSAGANELWLTTTNDNAPALRLYERLGFAVTEVRHGVIEQYRRIKPTIPTHGVDGVAITDELVLRRTLF